MSDQDKAERLAAQLRENLRKRKAQARALQSSSPLAEAALRSGDEGVSVEETPLSAAPTCPRRGRS